MILKDKSGSTLLFCVLYPGLSDSIVQDYIDSIQGQTDQQFHWLMINDNCRSEQTGLFPGRVTWINLDRALSFGKIREIGISYAIQNGYQNIIFSDIDDYYSANRVQLCKKHLAEQDFVFSELQIVNLDKELLHRDFISRLGLNPMPCDIGDILDNNFIGLSHSAVRSSALRHFEIPEDIQVVDWWLFSLLLIQEHRGQFVPEMDTFYRQNSENYVGVFNPLDLTRLRRGIGVKLIHYSRLEQYCQKYGKVEAARMFQQKHLEMELLTSAVAEEEFAKRYIDRVNQNFEKLYRGWWSEIISLEKWEQL